MIAALGAAGLWGILPIYWKALLPISSEVIIFYRIFFVAITTLIIGFLIHGKKEMLAPLKDRKLVVRLFIAGLLITSNWSVYIWAVNAGYIIQTSIGYYIEPLAVCVIGLFFFKEKLDKYKVTAMALATLGVAVIVIYYRQIPGIALALIVTFAIYAAIKKTVTLPPIISLYYETIAFMPIALAFIIYFEMSGKGALGIAEAHQYILLFLTGVMTAIPLGMYGFAATRIPLISLGITEYIAPSLGLLIGVFMYAETFKITEGIAFSVIWAGLICFTFGEVINRKIKKT